MGIAGARAASRHYAAQGEGGSALSGFCAQASSEGWLLGRTATHPVLGGPRGWCPKQRMPSLACHARCALGCWPMAPSCHPLLLAASGPAWEPWPVGSGPVGGTVLSRCPQPVLSLAGVALAGPWWVQMPFEKALGREGGREPAGPVLGQLSPLRPLAHLRADRCSLGLCSPCALPWEASGLLV